MRLATMLVCRLIRFTGQTDATVVTMNREDERMDLVGVRSVAEGAKGRKFGGLLCKHPKGSSVLSDFI